MASLRKRKLDAPSGEAGSTPQSPPLNMNTEAWDVFMNVSRDSGVIAAQCFEGPVRIVKCVIYLFFFCVILCALFASKVSLLMLTTGVADPQKSKFERDLIIVMLVIGISVPNLFVFIESITKSVFGNKEWPTFGTIFIIFVTETVHTFGLCLFVFRVLPQFDIIRALFLMSASCIGPAIMKLLLTKGGRGPMSIILDILALLMQCSLFFFITRYNTRFETYMDSVVDFTQTVASLVLVSTRYWENYIDRDICSFNIQTIKNNLRRGRCKTYIFASLWKVGLTLAFAYSLVPQMSPLAHLFRHIGNETAYDNSSLIDYEMYANDMGLKPDYYQPAVPIENDTDYFADLPLDVYNYGSDIYSAYDNYILPETPLAAEKDDPTLDSRLRFKRQAIATNESNEQDGGNELTNQMPPVESSSESDDVIDLSAYELDYELYQQYLDYMQNRNNANAILEEEIKASVRPNTNMIYPASVEIQNDVSNTNNEDMNIPIQIQTEKPQNTETPTKATEKPKRKNRRRKKPRTTTPPPVKTYNYDQYGNYYDILTGQEETEVNRLLYMFLPVIVMSISGAVCYYFARVACKLCMQQFSVSLPLTIVTPLTAIFFSYICHLKNWTNIRLEDVTIGHWVCSESYQEGSWQWQLGCAIALWWLSQIWVTNHIWFPKCERLAKAERLFVLPQYCGTFLEQGLLLNRRRNDFEEYPKQKHLKVETVIDETLSTAGSLLSETEKLRLAEGISTKILVCSCMWHETANEMVQVLKSIMRMDVDQAARSNAQEYFGVKDPDYYEFEAHIFIDDGMEENKQQERCTNRFVKQLVDVIELAASSIHETQLVLAPAIKTPTPYGGRLTWTLPGGNLLFVHIKDKNKIRHKKRWSQVMYMYYLLGYRLLGNNDDSFYANQSESSRMPRASMRTLAGGGGNIARRSKIFRSMNHMQRAQAENTYLLTLDGDIDYKAESVNLLVDRMKKNAKVGAACGRIHPIGTGPMVWYQKFEYAIGHWLQKAAEHMLGCVLCSPGCFSLFRGSAIMDDNVMRTYATKSTEARHYVQYDQGEDRWLCTLLLQQGYKLEYCAAADASTYAPETFHEFYKQRRRWIPSTLANMLDLMSDYHRTVLVNDNISYLYMIYQAVVMGASLLAPATVILMVAGAIHVVIGGNLYWLWLATSIGAAVFYMLVCCKAKGDTQISIAGYMSTAYAILMLAVTVGIVVQTSQDTWTSPNALFIMVITAIFVLAGLLHPEEFMCLIPGIIYFLCIPSGFLLMFIYSLINMNVVSWGTREIPKPQDANEIKDKKKVKTRTIVLDELKKIAVTFCCCIKQRCMHFIESRAVPSPPNKREQIVKDIIQELGKLETGVAAAAAPGQPQPPQQPGTSGLDPLDPHALLHGAQVHGSLDPNAAAAFDRHAGFERQSSTYGQVGSLLEERQKSIVRQLDSIHKDLNKIYEASSSVVGTGLTDPNGMRITTLQRASMTTLERSELASGEQYKDNESLHYGQATREDPYYSCIQNEAKIQRDDLVNPFWILEKELGRGQVRYLDQNETNFWQKLIQKYLYPIEYDKEHDDKIKTDLKTLRNNAAFLFFMLNFLWLFIIFLLQVVQDQLKDTLYIRVPTENGLEYRHFEPLSVAFLVFFALIILIQFISMLFHRYGTFLHILASTSLKCCSRKKELVGVQDILETVKVLQQIKGVVDADEEADPDYDLLGEEFDLDPDIVSCGAESTRRRKANHFSSRTLRGAFEKRYNALSKRSQKNKEKTRRPGIQQVFDNVAYRNEV